VYELEPAGLAPVEDLADHVSVEQQLVAELLGVVTHCHVVELGHPRCCSDAKMGGVVSLTQYYTATTLDGFIADSDNSLEWLFTRAQEPNGPLTYEAFIADVGALAMGSTTYEWLVPAEEREGWRWPYEIPSWVFTHRELPLVPDADVRFVSGEVAPVHEEMLHAAGGRNVWIVGGGDLAGQFADAGLLDEVIVWIAPVTLGAGAPLLPRPLELRLEEVARNGDFACARYSLAPAAK
jgi:dihydrofolate reductase